MARRASRGDVAVEVQCPFAMFSQLNYHENEFVITKFQRAKLRDCADDFRWGALQTEGGILSQDAGSSPVVANIIPYREWSLIESFPD